MFIQLYNLLSKHSLHNFKKILFCSSFPLYYVFVKIKHLSSSNVSDTLHNYLQHLSKNTNRIELQILILQEAKKKKRF